MSDGFEKAMTEIFGDDADFSRDFDDTYMRQKTKDCLRVWEAARAHGEANNAGVVPEKYHVLDNHKAPKHYHAVTGDIGYINGWNDAIDATQPAATGAEMPDLTSGVVNDCCWKFVEAMPHNLPGPIFNDLKPALYEALKHYHGALLTTQPTGGEWVRCDEQAPKLVGHYDAYTPTDGGRYPDAYWDGERWESEMDGFPIRGVTHYCAPTLPTDLPQPPQDLESSE